jgi:hypothetical protein
MIIDNPKGNCKFIKGIGPFSSGSVAQPGHEVVHATFNPLPPLPRGFDLIERHLQSLKRPLSALCGAGMCQKVEYVFQILEARLQEMQVTWADVTTVDIYTVHNIHPLMETAMLPALKGADRHGILWHYARPPVVGLECEMDARSVHQELVLPG